MAGVWEVIGGKTTGGIVVRTGKDTKSPEHADGRLSTGAIVAELETDGERLRYTLLTGSGPRDGWVSLKFKNSAMLIHAGDPGSKAANEATKAAKARESYGTGSIGRVWLMPQGTRGDVQPVVTLGIALRNLGMEVRVLAAACYEDFVESYGLRFTRQGVDCKAKLKELQQVDFDKDSVEANSEKWKEDPMGQGNNILEEWFGAPEFFQEGAKILMSLLEEERPDIIISEPLNGPLALLAWKHAGVPVCNLEFFPSLLDSDEQMMQCFESWQTQCDIIKEAVGVNPIEGVDLKDALVWRRSRTFIASHTAIVDACRKRKEEDSGEPLDPELVEKARAACHGFIILDLSLQMVDLREFGGVEGLQRIQAYLDAGDPPVYVGWGSMPVPVPFLLKIFCVLRMQKLRCIVCGGWAGLSIEGIKKFISVNMPEDPLHLVDYAENVALFVDVAPHEWLLQRCCLTIHHGGAGTMAAALRAGVPTIITPCAVDQFAHAAFVGQIGVGAGLDLMGNPEKLMDPTFSKTIRTTLANKEMKAQAKSTGEDLVKMEAATIKGLTDVVQAAISESREKSGNPSKFGGIF